MTNFEEKIENYAMDVSKYVLTGFVLSTFLHNFEENTWIMMISGFLIAAIFICIAYIFHRKNINKSRIKNKKK